MPEIKRLESGKLMCLEVKGPIQEQEALFQKINEYLQARHVSSKGDRLIILYDDPRTVDRQRAHYAAAVELAGEIAGDGDMTVVIQAVMPVACEFHRGPIEQLNETYDQLFRWIQEKGFQPAGPVREFYLGEHPGTASTSGIEIQIPVAKRVQS